jgi:hypothetical protein
MTDAPNPHDLELIRTFLLYGGTMSAAEVDEEIETLKKMYAEGDKGMFEFVLEQAREKIGEIQ